MRIVRLYTNHPDLFEPIEFRPGVNAVVARITLPENAGRTVHNLGKSTVARLIDFCLLKGRNPKFFLFKYPDLFGDLVVYLEVELDDGRYLTVARAPHSTKPVSILVSNADIQDATVLEADQWNHFGLGVTPAKRLLNGLLNFSAVAPYGYRDLMGYVLREQTDYNDVFQLQKFRGKHREWKPFLAKLLGLDASLTEELYAEIAEDERLQAEIAQYQGDVGLGNESDVGRIDGIIEIRTRDLSELTEALDRFDFALADTEATTDLVEGVENNLAKLNEDSYRLTQLIFRLDQSLQDEAILFSPDQAAKLFDEVGVAFKGQLKRDMDQLVSFNKAISEERRGYLEKERAQAQTSLDAIGPRIESLQAERTRLFGFLEESDTIAKYKEIGRRAIELRADIASLERQRNSLLLVAERRQEQRAVQERRSHLHTAIEQDVQAQLQDEKSRYREIRRYFDEIVHTVLGEHALLSVTVTSTGSLEFTTEIVDATGATTSASRGFTYKKLLCIAFDLAVLRAYSGVVFPRFAFHDGVFESLETRAKQRLIGVLRAYASRGLQPIITTLDSDLPSPIDSRSDTLQTPEVVLTLTDAGDQGRLFKTRSF